MCNLYYCYTFCTGVTLFALVLHLNCTALSQSEWSNFSYVLLYAKPSNKVYILNCGCENQISYDLRSYERNFCNCVRKPEKMICMSLTEFVFRYQFVKKAVLHLPEKSSLKSIVPVFCNSAPQWRTVIVCVVSVHCAIDHRIQGNQLYSCNNF